MGIIQCDKHGYSGFYDACEHIYTDLCESRYPDMKSIPVLDTRICEQCDQLLDTSDIPDYTIDELIALPEHQVEEVERRLSQKYNLIPNRGQFCVNCANEVQLKTTRLKGIPDPFEAFENTLLYENADLINELEQLLLSSYSFMKSVKPYTLDKPAMFLKAGTITTPFTITIYYVTDTSRQNKLLKRIDDFFHKFPLTQRRILFYKEEIWIRKKNKADTYFETTCEEVVVREELVK